MNNEPLLNYLDLNENNYIDFLINNALLAVNTMMVAKVIAINNDKLDVKPLQRISGGGRNIKELPTLKNVPFMRIMGGNAGIIIDYKVDDVVLIGCCQRDISQIKNSFNGDIYTPPTRRKFNLSDAIVISKLSVNPPSVYIKINDDGIEIEANNKEVNINNASSVNVGGTTPVALQGGSVTVPGVQTGSSTVTGTIDSGSSILKAGN